MDPDFAQRRRLFVAIAITAILVPAAFLLDRGGDDDGQGAPATAVVPLTTDVAGGDGGDGDGDDDGSPGGDDPMGTMPPGFLDGTAPPEDGGGAVIAIPRPVGGVDGTGTYDASLRDPRRCSSTGAPFGRTITVTNLDNQRSLQCIADIVPDRGVDDDHAVVLNPTAFAEIADFTEAPVPVRVTW